MGGIVALLMLSSMVGFVLSQHVQSESGQLVVANLNARIRAWWVTYAVFAVALLTGGIGSVVLFALTSFFVWQAGVISLVITLAGFAGGLCMSAIKRDRGIKDFGAMIEGHGGVMDRIDSICFAAPLYFHITRYYFT